MKTDKEEKQASQQNDEEQKPRRTMLRFEREGFVIPVWGILSIEKDFDICCRYGGGCRFLPEGKTCN